jgi:type IV pilus assembly protein PilF
MLKKIIPLVLCIASSACGIKNVPHTAHFAAAEINAKLAIAYLDQHDARRGKEKLHIAQKQAPANPVVWYMSGYFLERTGEDVAANQAYLQAIQLAPHSGEAQNNYGAFLCRQGKYQAAISYFLSAIHCPDYTGSANAYKNAAQCALKIPDTAQATQYFRLAELRSGEMR